MKYNWNMFLWSNWQHGSIGTDNGLALNRWQAIIWSKVGMFYWRIYVSFGLCELMQISQAISESSKQ